MIAGGLLILVAATTVLIAPSWLAARDLWQTGLLGRIDIWRAAAAMIRDNWLLGVGIGRFGEHFYAYRLNDYYTRYPHNLLLEVFAELGIVAVVLLSVFLIAAFTRAFQAVRSDSSHVRVHALAAAVLLFTHAMVDIDWHAPANAVLLMLLLAVSVRPEATPGC